MASARPDHVDWTHAPQKWTLGDLVRHIAAVDRWMFTEHAMGSNPRTLNDGMAILVVG